MEDNSFFVFISEQLKIEQNKCDSFFLSFGYDLIEKFDEKILFKYKLILAYISLVIEDFSKDKNQKGWTVTDPFDVMYEALLHQHTWKSC